MKKIIINILILTILLTPLSNTYAKDNKLNIAGDKNNSPYEYVNEDGEYVGFNVDIMKAISLEMGKEIKLLPMDWMEAHRKLLNGEIDAIQGMSFNEERKKIYSFSDSYLEDELLLFTLTGNKDIHNLNNLKGKKVSVQRHSLGAYVLSDLGEVEIDFTDDLKESFKALQNNKIDAILANKATALNTIKTLNIQNNINIVTDKIASNPYGIAFNKETQILIDEFNIALKNIKNNGTYQRIYEKWFGESPDLIAEHYKKIVNLLALLLILISIIILVIIRFNSTLKKQVNIRTKEIEEQRKKLLDSNIYRDQLIQSLGTGIIILDTNGYITDYNKKVNELLNIDFEKEKEKHYTKSIIKKYINPEIIYNSITTQRKYNSLEIKTNLLNVEFIYVYDIYPFLDYERNNIGTLLMIRDHTEVTRLRKSVEQKDKLESLGLLVSSIAHEIRNPLTAIKSYIDVLPYKYDSEKFRNKITEQVPVEIDRLNNLLTDLLEYSKPRSFEKEFWNLEERLLEVIQFLDSNLKSKNIELEISVPKNIYIYADRHQIRQVFINIILNSIDAIDNKGFIKIKSYIRGDNIIITIEDNGIGIDRESLDTIFDPFYTTKINGTGLGLSTAYNIMKENDADIKFEILETGTLLSLIFPKINKEDGLIE